MADGNLVEGANVNNNVGESIWQKRDRWANERRSVGFETLSDHPWLNNAVDSLLVNINNIRIESGADPIEFDKSNIRFIDEQDWNKVSSTVEVPEDTGGFLDRYNDTIYIKTNRRHFGKSVKEKMWDVYAVAHELAHLAMPDLEQISFHLSEGFADFVAREIFDKNILRQISDESVQIPFSRANQLNMIDRIRACITKEEFEEMLSLSFKGAGFLQGMLDERYGSTFMELINNTDEYTVDKIAIHFENKEAR